MEAKWVTVQRQESLQVRAGSRGILLLHRDYISWRDEQEPRDAGRRAQS